MAKYKKDTLGTRIKTQYENRYRYQLVRRTYTVIRVDGKAFHTWTRGLAKPFDQTFMDLMDAAALRTFKTLMGCKLAYGQSDEYSFVLTDFDDLATEAYFDGSVQKIASVAASTFTAYFNWAVSEHLLSYAGAPYLGKPPAMFDARVFQVPDLEEVLNYLVWREQDSERNSLSMLAQAHYSHKALQGKKKDDLHELLHAKEINWAHQPARFKRGGFIARNSDGELACSNAPIFTKNRDYLKTILPSYEQVHAKKEK